MTPEERLEALAGLPDYAVVVMVWPWPDGGWMAGIVLTDHEYAADQGMPAAVLDLPEFEDLNTIRWDVISGFSWGINVHGSSLAAAVEALWAEVHSGVVAEEQP